MAGTRPAMTEGGRLAHDPQPDSRGRSPGHDVEGGAPLNRTAAGEVPATHVDVRREHLIPTPPPRYPPSPLDGLVEGEGAAIHHRAGDRRGIGERRDGTRIDEL